MVSVIRMVVMVNLFGDGFHHLSYFAHGDEKNASRQNNLSRTGAQA